MGFTALGGNSLFSLRTFIQIFTLILNSIREYFISGCISCIGNIKIAIKFDSVKNTILLIFALCPIFLFSQRWECQKLGNSFDGFAKAAAILVDLQNGEKAMLGVLNESDNVILKWAVNEVDGINKLSVRIILPGLINPQKVLMAFDEERTNYLVNFSYSDGIIFIENATTPDYKTFLTVLDIVSFLKLKKLVHFRVVDENTQDDYSFPLTGSTDAISKTFSCPSYKRAGAWTDAIFELLYFQSLFSEVGNCKNNLTSLSPLLIGYIEDNYGMYFYTQIKSIECAEDESLPTLILKNGQRKIVAEISKESYLKNYFFFSGNPKRGENQKLNKDMETIKLYYESFQYYTDIIVRNKISLIDFSNLGKNELIPYYKSILNNRELLDYMRIDKATYYSYEVNEYTFDVFREAWGEQ